MRDGGRGGKKLYLILKTTAGREIKRSDKERKREREREVTENV